MFRDMALERGPSSAQGSLHELGADDVKPRINDLRSWILHVVVCLRGNLLATELQESFSGLNQLIICNYFDAT